MKNNKQTFETNIIKYILICFIFFSATSTMLSQNSVKGVVSDENKVPIPGVNIMVKGTKKGTVTDFDGRYTLNDVAVNSVLVYSYLGYKEKQVSVKRNNETINVTMQEDLESLDEVVVIGYGSVLRQDLTGAIATVKSEEITVAPTANFDQALVGRIAGVSITSPEGVPGAALDIVIRGGNSVTGSNAPLYVIDGIPLEGFDPATISTSDIESFNVLKDASATAIYGSRGANGVILITTKNGKTNGTTEVTLSHSYGQQYIPTRINLLNPYQYVKYREYQAFANDGWTYGTASTNFRNTWVDPELYRNEKGTDWQDEIFQLADLIQNNVTVSGGNQTTNIFYSFDHTDQEGTVINTGFKKLNNNLRVNHKFNDKTRISTSLFYSNSKRLGPSFRTDKAFSTLRNVMNFRPVEPVISDGLEPGGFDPNDPDFANTFNPLRDLQNTSRNQNQNLFRGSFSLFHKIADNLELKATGNFQVSDTEDRTLYGAESAQAQRTVNGISAIIETNNRTVLSTSNTLTHTLKKDKFVLTSLAGIEASQDGFESTRLRNNNLPTDQFGTSNIGIATTPTLSQSNASENTLLSYFGRANLALSNKYILTATYRADGSSKFAKQNRWGYFPSFSVGWKLDKEKFLKNSDFINSLRLRAGYGVTGNNRIPDYSAFNTIGISSGTGYVFGSGENYQPGSVQNNLAVPDLKWETTKQSNVGIDFDIFDFKISGTVDYYNKRTTDLLLNADMALSTGFNAVRQNVGEVSNKGLEISLNTVNIKTPSFEWTTSFNISTNKNEIIRLNDGQLDIRTNADYDFNNEFHYISAVGEPVGMMYGLQFERLYQAEDFISFPNNPLGSRYELKPGIPNNGNVNVRPGMAKFVDQDGNGTINELDRVVIGNPYPKHFGGLENSFKYKNFDVRFLLQWSYDFDIFNANRTVFGVAQVNQGFNRLALVADAWSPFNSDSDVNVSYSDGIAGFNPSGNKFDSRAVEDGSYIKLKTVAIGYSLPKRALEKIKLKTLRFTLSGQNIFTWTDYSGYDPDVSVSGNPLIRNLDFSAYPQSTTISVGVTTTF